MNSSTLLRTPPDRPSPRARRAPRTTPPIPSSVCAHTRAALPYVPDMLRVAKGILGSEDLAWDAVQETLLRVHVRGLNTESPRSVLVGLAVKSSLHQLRCIRRRVHHETLSEPPSVEPCEHDPLHAVESRELAQLVRREVRRLTEEFRSVLELFEFEGESYETIAERLSLPIGTVRSRLSRGRALLRERLLAQIEAA